MLVILKARTHLDIY